MDYTKKTKTFIAFVNKDGKDRWWLHGNYCFDEETPKIYPYDTKQDKEDAIEIGKRFGVWDETSDIEGLVLKVIGEPFSIINKKEAAIYHKQIQKEEEERVAERKAKEESEKKPKKEIKEEKVKVEESKPTPKIVPKVEELNKEQPTPKKRGRPKLFED
jgi:hypothetical protein